MGQRRYTRDDNLTAATELAHQFGDQLTHSIFSCETGISQNVVCRHFGN